MKKKCLILLGLSLFPFGNVYAGSFENTAEGNLRALAGVARLAHSDRVHDKEYHFPAKASVSETLRYAFNADTALSFSGKIKAQSGTHLNNLNQGNWGEEVFMRLESVYGDFELGQMQNTAVQLGVNRPDFGIWNMSDTDITDFIANPNWQRHGKTKYNNTLSSTLIDTDGSSFKLSYLSPEYAGFSVGASYIPQNNANDGLNSKFASYRHRGGYVFTLYHRSRIFGFDTDAYAAVADYIDSHTEYAGGLSLYRKGWTLFASYRQTQRGSSDAKITTQTISRNWEAFFDAYRKGKAYNGGIGYEFAWLKTTVSYFESKSDITNARNQILNWHNSVQPYKNIGFYIGTALVDFRADRLRADESKRGLTVYTGMELTF